MSKMFSHQHGYQKPEQEITVREDAPDALRHAVFPLGCRAGLRPYEIRNVVCDVLNKTPLPGNSPSAEYDYEDDPPEVVDEITHYIFHCEWWKVYDILEALYSYVRVKGDEDRLLADELNQPFKDEGIGWEMIAGNIRRRDPVSSIGRRTQEVQEKLETAGLPHTARELKEAFADISRRPTPDVTGAVHHAFSALEAVGREVTGKPKKTLGKLLIREMELKAPVNQALKLLWGYASNEARHGKEQVTLTAREARLIVGISADLCSFLISRSENEI